MPCSTPETMAVREEAVRRAMNAHADIFAEQLMLLSSMMGKTEHFVLERMLREEGDGVLLTSAPNVVELMLML
eukprot:4527331-Pleurochrysis_carterae.AAC.1